MLRCRNGGDLLLNLNKVNEDLVRGGQPLTLQQVKVVDHVLAHKVTVVSAGAGTGKTHTMIATVLHILDINHEVKIDDFALITFTNAAADEMRNRLGEKLEERLKQAIDEKNEAKTAFWFEQTERLASCFIGTIHSFCSMLLRTFGYEERIPHETEVLTARRYFLESMRDTMNFAMNDKDLSVLFNDLNWPPYEMRAFLETIYEALRNKGREMKDVLEETLQQQEDDGHYLRKAIVTFLKKLDEQYSSLKKNSGGVDTTDLLMITANVMEKYGDHILHLLIKRFKYVFVDEFQDTDKIQKRILDQLIPALMGILVVGDRKQAIYGWRGADDSVLTNLAKESGMEKPLVLSVSRRPTAPLLEAQNHLFQTMSTRYEIMAELLEGHASQRSPRDSLTPFHYVFAEKAKLPERIAKTITYVTRLVDQQIIDIDDKHEPRFIQYRDICMLFRSNQQLMNYAKELANRDIPFVIEAGGKFFQKPEIVGFYYMLQAILRYPNDVALDLLLQTPYLPIQPHDYTLRNYDQDSDPLCDWLASDERVRTWYNGMMEIRKRSKIDLVPQLLMNLLEFTKIREWYTKVEDYQAVANLEKLVMWSRDLMNSEALTLQQFTDRLQLAILAEEEMDEADIGEEAEKKDAVILSTIHSAKGLEYPIVFIPELQRPLTSDRNIPPFFAFPGEGLDVKLQGDVGQSSEFTERVKRYKKDLLEEEARVLYVAVTRAKNAVVFTSGGSSRQSSPEFWSWKDEVMPAFRSMPKKLRLGTS